MEWPVADAPGVSPRRPIWAHQLCFGGGPIPGAGRRSASAYWMVESVALGAVLILGRSLRAPNCRAEILLRRQILMVPGVGSRVLDQGETADSNLVQRNGVPAKVRGLGSKTAFQVTSSGRRRSPQGNVS